MLEASGIFYLLIKSGEKGVCTDEETPFSLSPLPLLDLLISKCDIWAALAIL